MKTFIWCEKNGNAVLYLSANNQKEAEVKLLHLVYDTDEWRFDSVEDIEEEN